jgi:hypothetical protein
MPTPDPTKKPSSTPTVTPSDNPTWIPTVSPSYQRTDEPTGAPTSGPTPTPITNGSPCEDLPVCTRFPGICKIDYLRYLCPFKCGECNTDYPTIMPTEAPTIDFVEEVNQLTELIHQLKNTISFLLNSECAGLCDG